MQLKKRNARKPLELSEGYAKGWAITEGVKTYSLTVGVIGADSYRLSMSEKEARDVRDWLIVELGLPVA